MYCCSSVDAVGTNNVVNDLLKVLPQTNIDTWYQLSVCRDLYCYSSGLSWFHQDCIQTALYCLCFCNKQTFMNLLIDSWYNSCKVHLSHPGYMMCIDGWIKALDLSVELLVGGNSKTKPLSCLCLLLWAKYLRHYFLITCVPLQLYSYSLLTSAGWTIPVEGDFLLNHVCFI